MNPCGIGQADDIETAWDYAYESDPVSIFGGIVVLNREVDAATARNAGMDCILVSWGFERAWITGIIRSCSDCRSAVGYMGDTESVSGTGTTVYSMKYEIIKHCQ